MASYRVATVNEEKRPLSGVVVEAVSLNSWPDVSATATTGRNGTVQFTGLTGPHFFRPRVRRTSATVGGRVYTGVVEVQVIALGNSLSCDYIVDSDGMGTHTALYGASGAIQAAMDAGGEKTIWVVTSETFDDEFELGGLNGQITIRGKATQANETTGVTITKQSRVVITAANSKHLFKQTTNAGGNNVGVKFVDIGLSWHSTKAILELSTTDEIDFLEFENCAFDGGYLLTNQSGTLMSVVSIVVENCKGALTAFWHNAWALAFNGPDSLQAYDNAITFSDTFWTTGGSGGTEADSTRVHGGRYTTANGLLILNHDVFFQNLQIRHNGADALFQTSTGSTNKRDIALIDLIVVFGHADGVFGDFQSAASGNWAGLFIDGIYGFPATGVSPTGTFLTVDTDWEDVHVGDFFGRDFSPQYSGPAHSIPGDLDVAGDLCVSDDAGVVGYLRVGSCTAPGNTTNGDLTAIRLFINNDSNFRLSVESSNPYFLVDANDYWEYNRSSNYFSWFIGSSEYFRVGGISQLDFFNGSILETTRIVVSSNGTTVTLALDQAGGGDLTLVFSDGFSTFDTTPAVSVSLTAGSDTSPQTNYVYILQSNKTLTVSTSGWPSEEHAPIAIVILQSAATTQTENALVVHLWHDHVQGSDEQGHYSHLGRWIRQHSATYESGVAQTLTITTNAGVPDNVDFATTAGEVYQMHLHAVPAFDTSTGTNVHVVNDSVSPYTTVTDLADLLTDSAGGSMSGKYFNLVLWASVSEETDETHLFVNLPSGSYNKEGDATDDVSGFTDFTIPDDFKGTAFLISRLTLRHQAASGGTWTSIQETDLRGLIPNLVAGGGTSAITTEFADNAFKIFDESDVTKLLAFQLSGITTGNTRTLTIPDGGGTLILATGLAGGQTLIGGTASGEDLTLQSTAHATRGSIFLGGSSKFELVEATGQLIIPTTGSGAGLLIGGDTQLYRSAANVLSMAAGDSLSLDSGGMILGPEAAIQFVAGGTNWSPSTEMGIGEWFSTLLLQGLNGMYFVIDPGDTALRNFFWYHGGDTNTGTLIMQLTEAGRLSLPIAGSGAGLTVGDSDFRLYLDTNPVILLDANDSMLYNRAGNYLDVAIGSAVYLRVAAGSVRFAQSVNNDFYAFADAGQSQISFDPNDYLSYNRAGNYWAFVIGSTEIARLDSTGKLQIDGEMEIDGDLNHDGSNIGFFAVAPVARASAYTQTYATADKTHANPTAAAVGDLVATSGGWGASTEANFDKIATAIDALIVDVADVKQLANAILDDLQAYGLFQ